MRPLFLSVVIFFSCGLGAIQGDENAAATNESKLRDALRNTMLQLRDTQNQVATLQASQAASDQTNADLKTKADALAVQVDTLTRQNADDKAASGKTIADLNTQIAGQADQVTKLNAALAEWKTAYNQAAEVAKAREAARAALAIKAVALQRMVEDREQKNLKLFKTGNEILTRYENFSLGDALSAKEPFVGVTRVQLQALVQDYQDKLLDQKVSMGQVPPVTASGKKPDETHSTSP